MVHESERGAEFQRLELEHGDVHSLRREATLELLDARSSGDDLTGTGAPCPVVTVASVVDVPALKSATQIFPFGDPVSFVGYLDFETAMYQSAGLKAAA